MSNPKDLPLDWFKDLQFKKLSLLKNVNKPHWFNLYPETLLAKLNDEVRELTNAIAQKKSPEDIIDECVDVANFAAMIAHKVDDTSPMNKISRSVKKVWRKEFLKFVNTGEASQVFLNHLDTDQPLLEAVDAAFKMQVAIVDKIAIQLGEKDSE